MQLVFVLMFCAWEFTKADPSYSMRPRQLAEGAYIQCKGQLEDVKVDFDSMDNGQPTTRGRIPSHFPEGISLLGTPHGDTSSNEENLALWDSSPYLLDFYSYYDNAASLRSYSDGKVVVVNSSTNSSRPLPSKGTMTVNFSKPVYQVKALRFLGIDGKDARSSVSGITATGVSLERELVPLPGPYSGSAFVFPRNWFNVNQLSVNLESAAALATLRVVVCRGETIVKGEDATSTTTTTTSPPPASTSIQLKIGLPCAPGTFSVGDGRCKPCRPGTFSNMEVSTATCQPCPFNTASSRGSSACKLCGHGTKANKKKSACLALRDCLPGFARSGIGGCRRCKAGHFSPGGFTPCLPCPPNSVALRGSSQCTVCRHGTQPSQKKIVCLACKRGSFSVNGKPCSLCPKGTFSGYRGATKCTKCTMNHVAQSGAKKCKDCPEGTRASQHQDKCLPCPPGRFSVGQGCLNCKSGTFVSSAGATKCEVCKPDQISTLGATSCTTCPSSMRPNLARTQCVPKACPPGYFGKGGDCNRCRPGTFSPGGPCQTCPAMQVSTTFGSITCKLCPDGTSPNKARTECKKL